MAAKVGHEAAIAKVGQFTDRAQAIGRHLDQVLTSRSFKGSRRSQEFLRYIIEKSLCGDFDELKERVLGVEIFGRAPTYNTSEDAIVRVAANEVRKRLLRYYEGEGAHSEFRIHLPSGSYIPEFSEISVGITRLPDVITANSDDRAERKRLIWPAISVAIALLFGLIAGLAVGRREAPEASKLITPWSAMFQSGLQTQLIFCDASIEMLQDYLHTTISLSDYANRRLLPEKNSFDAGTKRAAGMLGGADFTVTAAPVDLGIAMRISEVAHPYFHRLRARSARELRFRDFKSDGNFILLGSPRSNPWTALFRDQLDFYFDFDPAYNREVCRNRNPKPGERPAYVPTAMGGATGEAWAIAAFIRNPGQNGNVMILAGSNAEGTEAASRFVTDLDLLSRTLRKYGINPAGPPQHFEALLRVTTMAGSPNRFEVVSIHVLDDTQ